MRYQLEQGFHQTGAENLMKAVRFVFGAGAFLLATAAASIASGASAPEAGVAN
jgi:hypothetical protein